MNPVYETLQKAPALNKQELLSFLSQQETAIPVKLHTPSGNSFTAIIISLSKTSEEGNVITAELVDDRGLPHENYLYLAVNSIESIEIFGTENAIKILSAGTAQSGFAYGVSGKLDVNRAFKTFAEYIKQQSGINTGVPEMELPSDGTALNRIVKLTGIIQQTIAEILKSEDARESWQQKYNRIAFVNSNHFDVKGNGNLLQILFPFADTGVPELQQENLSDKIMSAL
ncbi:MAG TPA: hypothetical protein PKV73_08690 [Agriterribacter sp.]|nr:hypothetical protein [Agriterribacter sp.]